MRSSWLWILALAVVSTFPAAAARLGAAEPPESAEPAADPYTSIRRLPDAVTLATLGNGLTVIVQENHVAPVATVRCYVANTGSAFEGKYLGAGLSHVLEHVVSGGTTSRRTEKEISQIIDSFGGATNAYTSTDITAYFIDCPAAKAHQAIDLVADSMQRVIFNPEEFARELKVVRREMADGEVNRQRVLWKMLKQTLYTRHPLRHPIIGYIDVLNDTTNETIIDFYRSRYVPNNQVFVVVGDVDTQEALDEVARQFADTPRGRETDVPMPEEPRQLTPRAAVREMDGKTYDFVVAWPTVPLSHDDLYALDVAAYILGEGDSSRLVRKLKYDRQLVLSVSSASYTPHFANGFFAILGSASPETWEQAVDGALAEVYRLAEEPVGAAELAKAKKQKAAELVFGAETIQEAAGSLGRSYLSTGDPLFDKSYVDNIQRVTARQIQDAARRYFVPGRLNRIVLAPPGGAPKSAEQQAAAGETEVIASTLSNGLRVLVKRQSSLPMVNVQAFVLGGSLVDDEPTAGRSALLGAMLDKGTKNRTANEIAEYFDSIGGRFGMAAGRNTVFGSATVLKDDFPEALALFAECFTRPMFPDDQFKKMQTLALGQIVRRSDSPQGEAFEAFYDILPKTSPYHLIQGGKTETVKRLTPADLRSYHAKYFVPENMIVTVFGDVTPDEALKLIEQNFGGLKKSADLKPIDFDRSNAVPETIVRHVQTGKPTAMVLMGYPATNIFAKEDYAALTVLDAITSGYNYPGGWLHEDLRGEGLVYFVHAFQVAGPAPGFFAVMAQTRPDAIDEVVERIQRNLDRAKKGKITPDEFRTAVEMVLAMHAQENTTIGDQARQAALDELYGLGHDYDKSFDARIKAVKLDDVVRVAKKYLGNHVLVTTSPEAR